MKMSDKTLKIRSMAKEKSAKRQQEVISAIKLMKKNGEKISFYSVQKRTGASKSYLYTNEEISKLIQEAREEEIVSSRSKESQETIIKALNMKIKKLEAEVKSLKAENNDSYKAKYEKLLEENKQLKEQLKNSYEY